jgi:uncharacterized protein
MTSVDPELSTAAIAERLEALDWRALEASLWDLGYARAPGVLEPDECATLVALYADDSRFRSRVDMERHRFGVGDYKYFAHPLPPVVTALRAHAYQRLAPIANRWMEALGSRDRYPATLPELLRVCETHGQTRPTPLLLHYEAGGYNCLHQDLYGDVAFPLQITGFLTRPGVDHEGGEFLLVEQRPRAQSRGEVVPTRQGDLVIFTTRYRPLRGARGFTRVAVRHGVSRITAGTRYTLGVIFHDAK